jgi:hypothetical protein
MALLTPSGLRMLLLAILAASFGAFQSAGKLLIYSMHANEHLAALLQIAHKRSSADHSTARQATRTQVQTRIAWCWPPWN